jgi:Fur family ferric uptake transcriptional regulator
MNTKNQYRTKQHKEILSYLETRNGKHLTVNDICVNFQEQGKAIGTTTVYRQLERMVADGIVKKYTIDNNTPACFEYVGTQERLSEPGCYHCKCEQCGRLIHLECDELAEVQKHLLNYHGFQMNPLRTVIYGICENCRQ